jgi:hypothetical protein
MQPTGRNKGKSWRKKEATIMEEEKQTDHAIGWWVAFLPVNCQSRFHQKLLVQLLVSVEVTITREFFVGRSSLHPCEHVKPQRSCPTLHKCDWFVVRGAHFVEK